MTSQFGSFNQSQNGAFIQSLGGVRGYIVIGDDGLIPPLTLPLGTSQYGLLTASATSVHGYVTGTTTWEVVGSLSGVTSFLYTTNNLLFACSNGLYIKSSDGWTEFATNGSGIKKVVEFNSTIYGITNFAIKKLNYATRAFSTVYSTASEGSSDLLDIAVWGTKLVVTGNLANEDTDLGGQAYGVLSLNTLDQSDNFEDLNFTGEGIYIDGDTLVMVSGSIDDNSGPPDFTPIKSMMSWDGEKWVQYDDGALGTLLSGGIGADGFAITEYSGNIVFQDGQAATQNIYNGSTDIGSLDAGGGAVQEFIVATSGELVAVGSQVGIDTVTSKILKYSGSWSDWGGTSKPTANLTTVVAPLEYRLFLVPTDTNISVTLTSPLIRFLELTSVDIASGTTSGGTTVTLTGFRFTESTTVTFGGSSGTNVNFINKTTLEVDTPAGSAGPVDIVVSDSGNTATLVNGFTYTAITITSVDPTSGTTAGGTSVTVTGTGFIDGVTTVAFDRDLATNVVFNSSTEVTCDTPAHVAGTIDVIVYNGADNDTLTNGYTYT